MKKNFKKYFFSLFFYIFILLNSFSDTSRIYINFTKIVYSEEDAAFIRESDYSEEYKLNMIKILEYFDYPYLVKKGNLFISIDLDSDIQYLWNLCNKAEDAFWLEKRKSAEVFYMSSSFFY